MQDSLIFIVIFIVIFVFTGVKKSATKSAKIAVVITRHMWLNISTLDQTSSFDGLSQ